MLKQQLTHLVIMWSTPTERKAQACFKSASLKMDGVSSWPSHLPLATLKYRNVAAARA